MCSSRVGQLLFALMLCSAPTAQAQEQQPVEITPFVALGSSGASPVGAAITFPVTSSLAIETETGYRRGEGRIHALDMNVSLLRRLPRLGALSPYLAGGVGVRQHGTVVASSTGVITTGPHFALTVNAGGGFKVPVTPTSDLRTDARWFKSFGRNGGEQFRVAQGIAFGARRR